jgi:hypothetical protein
VLVSRLLTRRFVLAYVAFYAVWFAIAAVINDRWTKGFLGALSAVSFYGLFLVLTPLLLVLLVAAGVSWLIRRRRRL